MLLHSLQYEYASEISAYIQAVLGWQHVTNLLMLPVWVGCFHTCNEALHGISQVWDFLKGLGPFSLLPASHMYQKAAVAADLFASI